MSSKVQFSDLYEDKEVHRSILKTGLWLLAIFETILLLWAVFHAGTQSKVAVFDADNNKIYESDDRVMTTSEKMILQRRYGPLSNYRLQVASESVPFPFRAWLAMAVGIPIGAVLLLNYLIRAYLVFLSGGEDTEKEKRARLKEGAGFVGRDRWAWPVWGRLSIFSMGFLIVACLGLIWLIPNLMADVARGLLGFVLRFRWFFLGVTLFAALLIVWVIYLRYKIQIGMMKEQADIEKFRWEKNLLMEQSQRPALTEANSPVPRAVPDVEPPSPRGDENPGAPPGITEPDA